MWQTWYVLADGRVVDPRYVRSDAAGVLWHEDGTPVAVGPHGPRSRGVDVAALAQQEAVTIEGDPEDAPAVEREVTAAPDVLPVRDREMTTKRGRYKTR